MTQWIPPVTIRKVFPFSAISLCALVPVSQENCGMKSQWPGSMRNYNVLFWIQQLIGKKTSNYGPVQEACFRLGYVLCRRIKPFLLKSHALRDVNGSLGSVCMEANPPTTHQPAGLCLPSGTHSVGGGSSANQHLKLLAAWCGWAFLALFAMTLDSAAKKVVKISSSGRLLY